MKSISPTPMFSCFGTLPEAVRFRKQNGGWVFSAEDGQVFWFSLSFTPSAILTHPALRGLSGKLS